MNVQTQSRDNISVPLRDESAEPNEACRGADQVHVSLHGFFDVCVLLSGSIPAVVGDKLRLTGVLDDLPHEDRKTESVAHSIDGEGVLESRHQTVDVHDWCANNLLLLRGLLLVSLLLLGRLHRGRLLADFTLAACSFTAASFEAACSFADFTLSACSFAAASFRGSCFFAYFSLSAFSFKCFSLLAFSFSAFSSDAAFTLSACSLTVVSLSACSCEAVFTKVASLMMHRMWLMMVLQPISWTPENSAGVLGSASWLPTMSFIRAIILAKGELGKPPFDKACSFDSSTRTLA
mmetsp:Transcript_71629/g.232909  ORF Transcript_71629/g.232909 Transcript_71629/m.232909 type:complete len:292 (-) Transcript_71629:143-1018(-)